jgi:hypothetical protein
MLSYVGSEIDEVKMDHLTFFKVFHQLPGIEETIRFDHTIELDTKQQALLKPIGFGEENLMLATSLANNSWILKTLAFSDQLRKDLHELVQESVRQLACPRLNSQGLVAKLVLDTIQGIKPRHLVCCLLQDLQLYRDLHDLLDLLDSATATSV